MLAIKWLEISILLSQCCFLPCEIRDGDSFLLFCLLSKDNMLVSKVMCLLVRPCISDHLPRRSKFDTLEKKTEVETQNLHSFLDQLSFLA